MNSVLLDSTVIVLVYTFYKEKMPVDALASLHSTLLRSSSNLAAMSATSYKAPTVVCSVCEYECPAHHRSPAGVWLGAGSGSAATGGTPPAPPPLSR